MGKTTLTAEDQARVDSYLNGPIHQVDRKPFRPWLLLGVIVIVLTVLSLFSYGIAWWHGVV
ncbi:MAG: hypothetical protein ACI9NY_000267 [Kiritimatiellia bacterium]|jgi:hypothetical protein